MEMIYRTLSDRKVPVPIVALLGFLFVFSNNSHRYLPNDPLSSKVEGY